jgi:hypothetical protein
MLGKIAFLLVAALALCFPAPAEARPRDNPGPVRARVQERLAQAFPRVFAGRVEGRAAQAVAPQSLAVPRVMPGPGSAFVAPCADGKCRLK